MEFIRGWCLHIQPEQLTKTRYFGGWSSGNRTAYLARCKELLGQAETDADEEFLSAASDRFSGEASSSDDLPRCPHCDERALRLLHETAKPSWSASLDHLDPRCPGWYAELELEEHRRYLLEAHGIEYEDWHLETQVESAMKEAGPSPPPSAVLGRDGSGPRLSVRIILNGERVALDRLANGPLPRQATKFNARSIRARPVPA